MGGGAFLLTLSVIAGVLLITVPVANDQNNASVVHAAAKVVAGNTYNVIELIGDNQTNLNKIATCNQDTAGYYYYILTDDWDLRSNTRNVSFYSYAVIIDLNGHQVTLPRWTSEAHCSFSLHTTLAEVTDSSTAQTGAFNCAAGNMTIIECWAQNLTISGGTNVGGDYISIDLYGSSHLDVYGGNYRAAGNVLVRYMSGSPTVTVAPWVQATYNGSDGLVSFVANENYEQDGLVYHTLYLTSDNADNINKVDACNQYKNDNIRYVLTDDWDLRNNTANITFYNYAVIIDLNGCQVSFRRWTSEAHCNFSFHTTWAEITDSSRVRRGVLNCTAGALTLYEIFSGTLTIAGGTKIGSYGVIDTYGSVNLVFKGGSYATNPLVRVMSGSVTMTFAAWVTTTYSDDGKLTAVNSANYFAVSDSKVISGAYNYAVGYTWDLTAGELWNLAVPVDKAYYLWGRNADGAYEYLNTYYDGSKRTWVAVAPEISVA